MMDEDEYDEFEKGLTDRHCQAYDTVMGLVKSRIEQERKNKDAKKQRESVLMEQEEQVKLEEKTKRESSLISQDQVAKLKEKFDRQDQDLKNVIQGNTKQSEEIGLLEKRIVKLQEIIEL